MYQFFLIHPHIIYSLLSFVSATYLFALLLYKFRSRGGISFAVLTLSMGLWQFGKLLGNLNLITSLALPFDREFWHRLTFLGATFIYPTFFLFACRISFRDRGINGKFVWAGFLSAILYCVLDFAGALSHGERVTQYGYYRIPNTGYHFYTATYFLYMGLGLFVLIPNFYRNIPQIRHQTTTIFYSALIGFGCGALEFAGIYGQPIYPLANLSPFIFGGIIYWAIYRYNVIAASDLIKTTQQWILYFITVLILVFGIYHASEWIMAAMNIPPLHENRIYLYAGFIFALTPLYLFLLKTVRRKFFPVRFTYKELYSQISGKLAQLGSSEEMVLEVIRTMEREFGYEQGTGVLFPHDGSEFLTGRFKSVGHKLPDQVKEGVFKTHSLGEIISRRVVIAHLRISMDPETHFRHLMDLRLLNRLQRDLLLPIFHQNQISGVLLFNQGRFRPESWGTVELILNSLTDILSNHTSQLLLLKAQSEADHFSRIGMMSATLAHEIKNPLGGIYGAAQILMDNPEDPEPFLNIILKDSTRLNDVVRRFLTFSDPFRAESSRFDLNSFTENFVLKQNSLPDAHPIKLEAPSGPLEIHSDPGGIEQILLNLVQNARRYQETEDPIRLLVHPSPPKVQIIVENTGPPIPEEARVQIFTPFYTTSTTGTGLGLATSRKIAKALRGDLYFVSKKLSTRFVLELPAG